MGTYLRVEAQNLGNTLFDTDKLSVIRGGSLMLRDAILTAEKALRDAGCVAVRVGAEAAVFRLGTDDAVDAAKRVRTVLAEQAPEFTFAVVAASAASDRDGIDRTLAVARWRQGRLPRFAPEPQIGATTSGICSLTRVRAGPIEVGSNTLSASAKARLKRGQELKRRAFYREEADPVLAESLGFVDDLGELTDRSPYPSLDGKMAVLVIDGNGFGSICASLSTTDARLFDNRMRELRRALLTRILKFMVSGDALPSERMTGDRIRLEVLQWAGDEFQLVCPGWLGVRLLQEVFDEVGGWRATGVPGSAALTVSAGLLVCSHKLPIHRALRLADSLMHRAKRAAKRQKPMICAWDYMVLESLDFPAALDLAQFWRRRLPARATHQKSVAADDVGPAPLLPCPNYAQQLSGLALALDQADSRRKVYASAQLIADPSAVHHEETQAWQATQEARDILAALHKLLAPALSDKAAEDPAMVWLHLRELWDYLLPRRRRLAKQPGATA